MNEIELNKENFEKEVLSSDIPVIVDFWATWCGPCQMIAGEIDKLAKEFNGKIKVGKVNVDEEMELSIKYQIDAIPAVLYFKNGKLVKKSIGFATEKELIKEFEL